jgi:hypothetical protein
MKKEIVGVQSVKPYLVKEPYSFLSVTNFSISASIISSVYILLVAL